MSLQTMTLAAGLALTGLALVAPAPASASVEYSLYLGNDPTDTSALRFSYIAPTFVSSDLKVEAKDLQSCGAFLVVCDSVSFLPSSTAITTNPVDLIIVEGDSAFSGGFEGYYRFTLGAFGKPGHYVDPGSATLDISIVPLPSAAPLLGLAILVVGVAGYGVKRKAAAPV